MHVNDLHVLVSFHFRFSPVLTKTANHTDSDWLFINLFLHCFYF